MSRMTEEESCMYMMLLKLVSEFDDSLPHLGFQFNQVSLEKRLKEAKAAIEERRAAYAECVAESHEEEYCEQEERAIMQDEMDRYGEDVYWEHAGIKDYTFAELDNVTYNDAGEPIGYC